MDHHLPWGLPPRGALHNARQALASISSSVAERLALTEGLTEGNADEPGGLHAMTAGECRALLMEAALGRVAYIARADTPDIVLVNYAMDGDDVLIRSGPGPKLQAAERRSLVAFEVDAVDAATRTGRSVVVIGRATRLRPPEQRQHSDLSAAWAAGPRHAVIRIRPIRITGRRLS